LLAAKQEQRMGLKCLADRGVRVLRCDIAQIDIVYLDAEHRMQWDEREGLHLRVLSGVVAWLAVKESLNK
jgi:hypothetical protein